MKMRRASATIPTAVNVPATAPVFWKNPFGCEFDDCDVEVLFKVGVVTNVEVRVWVTPPPPTKVVVEVLLDKDCELVVLEVVDEEVVVDEGLVVVVVWEVPEDVEDVVFVDEEVVVVDVEVDDEVVDDVVVVDIELDDVVVVDVVFVLDIIA